MALWRGIGARKDATRGTSPIEVRKTIAALFSSPGVLPGGASPLVTGDATWAYNVGIANFVTSRGASDGDQLYGNDGVALIGTTGVGSTVPIAPGAGLSRIDIAWTRHPTNGENADTSSEPMFGVASGVAASSNPVAPTIPAGAIELGRNLMTSAATSTVSVGNMITQSALLTALRGIGAPTAYTPVLTAATTNPTNITATGRFIQVGKQVTYWFSLTAATGFTAGSGNYAVSLPVPTNVVFVGTSGSVRLFDASAGQSILGTRVAVYSSTQLAMQYITPQSALNAYGTLGNVGHAGPWAWAAGDLIDGFITYEAA